MFVIPIHSPSIQSPSLQTPPEIIDRLSEMHNAESKVQEIHKQNKANPRIQKVRDSLRKIHKETELFEPQVVSIGPYHYSKPHLLPMEDFKKAATKRFIGDTTSTENFFIKVQSFFIKVQEVATEAKECYAELPPHLCHDQFVNMMFYDGCFLLHLINLFTRDKMDYLPISKHRQGSVMKDIFLLENQIPYIVLKALMSKKDIDIQGFFKEYLGTFNDISLPDNPNHLLGLLRSILIGKPGMNPPPVRSKFWKTSRSASELVKVGIQFKGSNTLRDISFKSSIARGRLMLPVIIVNDLMLSRFLNLIAFEMSPNSVSDAMISSYVWLMDQLIQQKEDVKELRSSEILLNELGNDQQVADLFHRMAMEIEPDRQLFYGVMHGIDIHCSNKIRVSIVRPMMVHFSQWGTNPVAFAAATFLLILTVVQTIFAVKPSTR